MNQRLLPLPALLVWLLFSCQHGSVSTWGYLSVQFLTFTSSGRNSTGGQCDSPSSSGGAYNPCDPQFRITGDQTSSTGSGLFSYQQSSYYSNQENLTFTTIGFAGWSNPMTFGSWSWVAAGRNTVWFGVEVRDYDTSSVSELMGKVTSQLTLSSNSSAVNLVLSTAYISLSLKYWFTCDSNYYGQYCDTYCSNTIYGWCDSAGQKSCYYGWVNASTGCTTKHPCRTCVCQNGGTCVPQDLEGYTCHCPLGYSGSKCETCSIGSCSVTSASSASSCDFCTNCY